MQISEKQQARRREIFEATYTVLAEKGYKGCSILDVARAARASNETLYNWFGNKQGLLAAMVAENACTAAAVLDDATGTPDTLRACLARLGPVLLHLVTGDRAVALNRAAAADVAEGGILGQTIAEHGRNMVAGRLLPLFQDAAARGEIAPGQAEEVVETFLGVLIGDVQIRRVIGVLAPLGEAEARARTERALAVIGM